MCSHKDTDCLAGFKGGRLETKRTPINRGFVTPHFGISILKQAYCIGIRKSTNYLENQQAIQLLEGTASDGAFERVSAAMPVWKGRVGPTLAAVGGSGKSLKGLFSLPLNVA